MNSAIQLLNQKICEAYLIEVSCDQSHVIDVYNEGELEEVNFCSDFYTTKKYSSVDCLCNNLRKVIENILKTYTQFNTFEEYEEDDFNYNENDFVIYRQVNKELQEPTLDEVEMWKVGEEDLYSQYTHIKIKINSTLLDLATIRAII